MKGITKEFGLFLRMMNITLLVITLVAAYFSIAQFTVTLELSPPRRTAFAIGEALLSCPELTDGRGLFVESKFRAQQGQNVCTTGILYRAVIRLPRGGTINIGTLPTIDENRRAQFGAAVRTGQGVLPTVLEVYV